MSHTKVRILSWMIHTYIPSSHPFSHLFVDEQLTLLSTDGNNDDLESTGTGVNSQVSTTAHDVLVPEVKLSPPKNHDDDVLNEGLMPMPSLRSLVTGGQGTLPHTALHNDPVQRRMMTVISTIVIDDSFDSLGDLCRFNAFSSPITHHPLILFFFTRRSMLITTKNGLIALIPQVLS